MDADTALTDLLAQAWAAYDRRDLRTARGLAEQARGFAPMSPEPIAALAWFLLEAGELDAASNLLTLGLQDHPEAWALWWYSGLLHQRQRNLAAAADDLRRACCGDPGLDSAAFTLAWILHDLGQLTEALAWSRYATQIARSPERLQQLAWLALRTGEAAEADGLYRELLDLLPPDAPERPLLRRHHASALEQSGQTEAALTLLQEEAQQHPDDSELIAALAWSVLRSGDRAATRVLAERLTHLAPAQADGWHLLGLIDHAEKAYAAADVAYAKALVCDPALTDLLLRRATVLRELQRYSEAEGLARAALAARPEAAAEALLLQLLLEQRKAPEARARLHACLRVDPTAADLWRLLAVALDQQGRGTTGFYAAQRACRLDPDNIEAHRLLGWLAHQTGRTAVAAQTARRVIALTGGDVAGSVQAAFLLEAAVKIGAASLAEAAVLAERAVWLGPQEPEAWRALGYIRLMQQRWDDAETALIMACDLAPDPLNAARQLVGLYLGRWRLREAETLLRHLLADWPEDRVIRAQLAETSLKACAYTPALDVLAPCRSHDWPHGECLAAAILTERGEAGDWAEALSLATQCFQSGPAAEGASAVLVRLAGLGFAPAEAALALLPRPEQQKLYRHAIRISVYRYGNTPFLLLTRKAQALFPDDTWFDTAAFFATGLDESLSPAVRSLAARHWYRRLRSRVGVAEGKKAPARREGDKIRIAYIAGYLHASLLKRVLSAHDRARVTVYLYTDAPVVAAEWGVVVEPLAQNDLVRSFAANRIDIAIDTVAPHPFEGQDQVVTALARRIAPVQIAWLGTWGTGGGLYDALLTDTEAVPLLAAPLYHEEILRIPGGQWAWEPPSPALSVPVGPLPAEQRGFITFAAAVRGLRLSPRTFATWAHILAGLPGSRLEILGYQAEDGPQQRAFAKALRAAGVKPSRVTYHPPCSYAEHLRFYQGIDIALDAVPANGGLCLLDPLWMGVPIVSRAGPWASDRQGRSVLASLGLPELCAETDDDFIAITIALAQDLPRLADLRRSLRDRVQQSPLTDGSRIARFIEAEAARLLNEAGPIITAPETTERAAALADRAYRTWRAKGERLALPKVTSPEVSVIVTPGPSVGLTWETLRALADQEPITAEIVLADGLPGVTGLRSKPSPRARYHLRITGGVILQADALAQGLAALEQDAAIDAVTGRLIAADGRLLEAGRLLYPNGAELGYGVGSPADTPEVRFRRLTPRASPEFLLTRAGKTQCILFVPEMVAQHWAASSAPPQPALQPINPQPLKDRWADRPGPRVLVIDDAGPRLTAGAGLPRARSVLHGLAEYPVTLFPLWRHEEDWREVYKAVPPTVEVMVGLGIDRLEAFSEVYDAEAVFARREIGQAAINGHASSDAEAARQIADEIALADGVERVLVVSDGDGALYAEAGFPDVRLLSHSIAPRRAAPGPRGRDGLFFVGALDPNTPNEDSLLWFAETILPHLPSVTLSIVGECRSARVAALAGERVRLLGPQEDLTPFYDAARVFIAPTRFAGGIPAKVIEAAANGIPVVATPLLVGQLGWRAGTEILEAGTPEDFTAAVAQLLTDDSLWRTLQARAWERVAHAYNPDAFADSVRRAVRDPIISTASLAHDDDGEIIAQQAVD